MMPCSAATVIGIVCEADVASRPDASLVRAVLGVEAARAPAEQRLLARERRRPPSISSKRPDVASFERVGVVDVEPQRARERDARAPPPTTTRHDRRPDARPAAEAQPREHGQAEQQRGEARLRERREQPAPQHDQRGDRQRQRCAAACAHSSTLASPIITSARKRP